MEIFSSDNNFKKSRYYNLNYRKKLINRITKLKNKNDYVNIYKIIVSDIGNNFSSNSNGIFININLLSDNCIAKLDEYIITNTIINIDSEKISNKYSLYNSDKVDEISNIVKLSNQEKNILKRSSSIMY